MTSWRLICLNSCVCKGVHMCHAACVEIRGQSQALVFHLVWGRLFLFVVHHGGHQTIWSTISRYSPVSVSNSARVLGIWTQVLKFIWQALYHWAISLVHFLPPLKSKHKCSKLWLAFFIQSGDSSGLLDMDTNVFYDSFFGNAYRDNICTCRQICMR